jgi:predicted secreted protein
MRKILRAGLALALAFVLLAGCQATPEQPVVIQKDLEQMIALALADGEMAGSLADRLGVPDRYESYVEDAKGSFKVTVDAAVILPDADSLPIIRVEAQPVDQQAVDKLIAALFEPGKLYDPYWLSELTQSEIAPMLARLRADKAKLEQQGVRPLNPAPDSAAPNATGLPQPYETSIAEAGNQLDQINQTILALEQQLQTAPETKRLTEVSGQLGPSLVLEGLPKEEREAYEGKRIEAVNAAQMNPSGGMRSMYAANNETYNEYRIEYIDCGDFATAFPQYSAEDEWAAAAGRQSLEAIPNPAATPEQAQTVADRFLDQLGIDYMTCAQQEKVVGTYGTGGKAGTPYKAYRLQYVRMVQNVPVTYTYIEGVSGGDGQTIWNWAYEGMTLVVDDNGVIAMDWTAPYRLRDTLTLHASVLPFSEIRKVFEKMILISNSYYTQLGADMNITEVRLGLARITEQNNQTQGLLIPVWDFFGTLTTRYEENGEQKTNTLKDAGQVWLTINAIDGSIIDRSLGY